jgi:APA family basic amino acid/polyamine antiporter
VVIGLGSMLGAGVFVVFGLAARVVGTGLLAALGVSALVAFCNATSSAQLAAVHPSAGGTYIYGRERLGHLWGFAAGWGFVLGKTASCAAIALTIGRYLDPARARLWAVGAVLALAAINYRGVEKTAVVVRTLVTLTITTLALSVVSGWLSAGFDPGAWPPSAEPPARVLEAAALMFFAFAGYARIGTLGEEVRDPARTIPRAISVALLITLLLYSVVAATTLATLGPVALAASAAPLADVAAGGPWPGAATAVRMGAVIAGVSSLLTLLAGVSRTVFAMAANRDLPRPLAGVHPRFRTPGRAEIGVTALVVAVLLLTDLANAVGFSSFLVLAYYAVANVAAWRLAPAERRWPRGLSAVGLVGCVALAMSLPVANVIVGGLLLLAGVIGRALVVRRRPHAS